MNIFYCDSLHSTSKTSVSFWRIEDGSLATRSWLGLEEERGNDDGAATSASTTSSWARDFSEKKDSIEELASVNFNAFVSVEAVPDGFSKGQDEEARGEDAGKFPARTGEKGTTGVTGDAERLEEDGEDEGETSPTLACSRSLQMTSSMLCI